MEQQQKKKTEKSSNEIEVSNLPDIELKKKVIIMLNKLESWIEEIRENFNKSWEI